MKTRFDAVIIGGGPAGAIAALRLARMGWRTALIERGPRHRHKTCGHCLNPRALGLLKRHGLLQDVLRLSVGPTRSLLVHWPEGHRLASSLTQPTESSSGGGILIERHRFDQLLIDRAAAAGAHIIQPAAARVCATDGDAPGIQEIHVIADGQSVRLQTHLAIGADGVGSAVARATGLSDDVEVGRKYGFSFDLPPRSPGVITAGAIEMFVAPGGYLGAVQQANGGLHLAAMVSSNALHIPGARDPMAFVRFVAAHHDSLRRLGADSLERDEVENFTAVGPMPWRPRAVANARAALVGDAARYVEPFTGEGMSWAIESADILGDALAGLAPGAWNGRTARHYAGAWKSRIGRRQRVCRFMAFTLARPRFSSLLFRAGAEFPALTRRFVRQVMAT